ncbi:MAG: phenylacetate--CoA ligase family protein [Rhodospirillales bacterium]|jgi:phenylacetate-CoA ligase
MTAAAPTIPYYCKSVDWDALIADYPPPPHFEAWSARCSDDELRALQDRRFMARVADAWAVPFYRRRWTAAGLEPGDIRSIDDSGRIPTFNSDDLKAAIAEHPPFGSHHPFGPEGFGRQPLKIQTSGGTTGLPRVTLFDAVAMEVQGIQTARALYAQGTRPGDVVQITYTNSLANSAWCALSGIQNWLGAVPMTTGAGQVTPSERQLEYAAAWGTTAWFSRGEYLARLAQVAQETGLDLRTLRTRQIHSFLGPDTEGHLRARLEAAWGAPIFDNYGTHEIGLVAFECRAKDRMHVNEDTVFIEFADEHDGTPAGRGVRANLVATSLHRSVPPIVRFNMRDLMIGYDRAPCACGLCTTKLSTFLGRSDEMVKLRGTNVYPLACQPSITRDARATGEFLCVVWFVGEGLDRREDLVVRAERRSTDIDADTLRADLAAALHKDLGVRVGVEIVDPGTLAPLTGLGSANKVKRLLDLRRGPAQ